MKPKVLAAAAQKLKHLAPEFPSEMEAQPLPRLKPRPTQPRTRLTTARSPPPPLTKHQAGKTAFMFPLSFFLAHTHMHTNTHTPKHALHVPSHTHNLLLPTHSLLIHLYNTHCTPSPPSFYFSLSLSPSLSLSTSVSPVPLCATPIVSTDVHLTRLCHVWCINWLSQLHNHKKTHVDKSRPAIRLCLAPTDSLGRFSVEKFF